VQNAGLVEPVLKSLKDEGLEVEIFDKIVPNPRDTDCELGAKIAKEKRKDNTVELLTIMRI